MAFYKKTKKKINGLWYPQTITVGKPVRTDEVGKRLSAESTISPADTVAVLKALGGVLGEFMSQGRTVQLDGLGTFYYACIATGKGVDAAEKVTASQISGVRVRFILEAHKQSGSHQMTRALVSENTFWVEWGGKGSENSTEEGDDPGDDPTIS